LTTSSEVKVVYWMVMPVSARHFSDSSRKAFTPVPA
jgi:hypothetical protein